MAFGPQWQHAWLIAASFLAGALNAMAGGGSFLSFPALLGVGVLPIQANATNTVALWPGQFTSIAAYWQDLKANVRLVIPVCSAALLGGVVGAIVLLHTGQATFLALVPWLLLLAAGLFAASGPVSEWLRRRTRMRASADQHSAEPSLVPLWFGVVAVCFYIGYFGAGAGFLMMSVLAVFGIQNINQVNALKVIATTTANGIAVITFIVGRQILWKYCLLMMLAAAVGGYLGAHYSRGLNPRFMRTLVVAIGLGMAAYFFWKQYA
jgi:uncharacterized membrane protein YfcA